MVIIDAEEFCPISTEVGTEHMKVGSMRCTYHFDMHK